MLSPKNYNLLKSYCSPRVPRKSEGARFEQLRSQRLIVPYSHKRMDLGNIGNFPTTDKWVITELGKDALAEFKHERVRFRFPLVLSIIAIIISIISILLQLLKLI